MDPEILRALRDGVPPAAIVAELQRRGLPVPPQLMQPEASDATSTPQAPAPGPSAAALGGLGASGIAGAYGATAGARRYISPTGRATARLQGAVDQSGGVGALLRELGNYDAAGRGGLVTLGDLARPLGEQGTDFVATNNEHARSTLQAIHDERRRGVPQRLLGDVEQLSPTGYAAPGYLGDLSKRSQQDFADSPLGYRGLREANPVIDPRQAGRLGTFLESPQLQKAWQDAAGVGAIGPLPSADALSFETLQNLKERLDGLSDAAWRKGDGDLGKRLGAARDHLVGILRDAVPGYEQVSAQYARFAQHQAALELGGEIWSNHAIQLPDLQRQLADMTPEQLKAVRQGVVGGFIKDIENAKTNRNLANELMERSATTERKLELIFGSEQAFTEAVKRFSMESSMSRLGGYIGGSATARRLSAGEALPEAGAEAVMTHPTSPSGIVGRVLGKVPQVIKSREAARLEPYFTTQGSEAIRELLRNLRP